MLTNSTSRFKIVALEERIAPAPAWNLISSVDRNDPAVNGAEHACKGLMNNHAPHDKLGVVQLYRHGCLPACGCS